jgi:protoheme IX farnesyltransferase
LNKNLKIFSELTKIKITSFVALTTAFGFIAASGKINFDIVPVLLGVLLLAFGSAALNHYQERNFDAMMDRTKNRPIPSGRISSNNVLLISVLLVISGSVVLLIGSNLLALCFGLINLVWYNFVYTLLKRKTAFAIVPGSLVGAIPPVIGWVAAGGELFDPQILAIAFFFFVWQIPHFWLLLLVMDKDYRKAGFPTLTQIFSRDQLLRITFVWITSTAVTGFMISLFGLVTDIWISFALFLSCIWLTWKAFKLLTDTEDLTVFRLTFGYINYFALFVVFMVSINKLIFYSKII